MDNSLVYHYTSVEALFKILTNIERCKSYDNISCFKIHATHYKYLNDLKECQILPNALAKLESHYNSSLIYYMEMFPPHIISLCNNEDDLTMWRSYASNGYGINIGLDKVILEDSCKENEKDTNMCLCGDCQYVTEDELFNYVKDREDIKQLKNNEIKPKLVGNLLKELMLYKDKAFEAESEYRCVLLDSFDEEFRIRNSNLVMFKKVTINTAAIKSITFGPCVSKYDFSNNEIAIKKILHQKQVTNYEQIEIKKSKIPYLP